jgi:hypothetical protein
MALKEKKANKADNESFEQKLWKSADKLRKNIDPDELGDSGD